MRKFLKAFYEKIFKINDTPQKIAVGLGLGVFLGILPGTGPIAALFLALLFKVNRASALFGSLLSNTWLSIVTFILSIKVGSAILHSDWQQVQENWSEVLRDFHWGSLFKSSVLTLLLPVVLGYLIIGLSVGFTAYIIALLILRRRKHENKS